MITAQGLRLTLTAAVIIVTVAALPTESTGGSASLEVQRAKEDVASASKVSSSEKIPAMAQHKKETAAVATNYEGQLATERAKYAEIQSQYASRLSALKAEQDSIVARQRRDTVLHKLCLGRVEKLRDMKAAVSAMISISAGHAKSRANIQKALAGQYADEYLVTSNAVAKLDNVTARIQAELSAPGFTRGNGEHFDGFVTAHVESIDKLDDSTRSAIIGSTVAQSKLERSTEVATSINDEVACTVACNASAKSLLIEAKTVNEAINSTLIECNALPPTSVSVKRAKDIEAEILSVSDDAMLQKKQAELRIDALMKQLVEAQSMASKARAVG